MSLTNKSLSALTKKEINSMDYRDAVNLYYQLAKLPQCAPYFEWDGNGYPIIYTHERLCRMPANAATAEKAAADAIAARVAVEALGVGSGAAGIPASGPGSGARGAAPRKGFNDSDGRPVGFENEHCGSRCINRKQLLAHVEQAHGVAHIMRGEQEHASLRKWDKRAFYKSLMKTAAYAQKSAEQMALKRKKEAEAQGQKMLIVDSDDEEEEQLTREAARLKKAWDNAVDRMHEHKRLMNDAEMEKDGLSIERNRVEKKQQALTEKRWKKKNA